MSDRKAETLLCIIPFPEPEATIASIQKKFPHLKINFKQITPSVNWQEPSHTVEASLWKEVTILCTLSHLPEPPSIAPNLGIDGYFCNSFEEDVNHT